MVKDLLKRGLRTVGYDAVRAEPGGHSLHSHVASVLSRYGINCVLDVGADVGDYARRLRRDGYRGRIVSFEPVGASFEELERRSHADPGWRVVRTALGAESGLRRINVARDTPFSSFLPPNRYGLEQLSSESAVAHQATVEVRRLDELYAECVDGIRAPRTFLKLTTQGLDLEVWEGAEGCRADICAVLAEMSVKPLWEGMPGYLESLPAFTAAGLELSGLYPIGRDERLRLIRFDCVMVRGDRLPGLREAAGTEALAEPRAA